MKSFSFCKFFPLMLLLVANAIFAESRKTPRPIIEKYGIRNFTDESGLPQNSAKDLILDHSGFLWIATENGTARFDGRNFKLYNANNTQITTNRFTNFTRYLSSTPDLFYAVTDNSELLRVYRSRVRRDTIVKPSHLPRTLSSRLENAIWLNNLQNNFWSPSPRTIYVLPVVEKQNTFFRLDSKSIQYYEDAVLKWQDDHQIDFFGDFFHHEGTLYHVEKNGNILQRSQTGARSVAITGDFFRSPSGSNKKVYSNNNMSQVFLYADKKLYLLSQKEPGLLHARLLLSGLDLKALSIASVLFDSKTRTLYMGSLTKGLLVVTERFFSVLEERVGNTRDNVFYAQAVLDSNTVITPQRSIIGLDPSTGSTIYAESSAMDASLSGDRYSMAKDASGNFWTKSENFLILYDSKSLKKRSQYTLPTYITQIKPGQAGDLWIGTRGGGLYRQEKDRASPNLFMPLDSLNISCLTQEDQQTLWIGASTGLFNVDLPSKTISEVKLFRNSYIRSLHIPEPGEVWVTTYEKGFYLIKNGKITSFPLDKSAYLSNSHCIVEDTLGFIWIPTNKGLFQTRKSDLMAFAESQNPNAVWYKRYDSSSGFKTNEFNGGCEPCAIRLPNGYVSLPSLNGLVWFRPEAVRPGLPSGQILLDRAFADGRDLSIDSDTLLFSLPPNHLQLNLSTPYYGPEDELHLQYALIKSTTPTPLPSEWLQLKDDGLTLHLFNIKPGNYTLLLKKKSGFGINNYTYKKIHLAIPTVWYNSWWFYSLVIIAIGAWLLFVIALNGQFLKRRNEQLENAVKERTSELNTLLRNLKLSKEDLTKQSIIKEQIIASISHDIKTPLRFLNRLNETLYRKLVEIGDEDILEMCRASYETGRGLDILLTNLLDYVKTNPIKANKVVMERLNLRDLIENKIEHFKLFFSFKDVLTIRNTIDSDIEIVSNSPLLGIIVQNLLDNSLKASSPDEVVIVSFSKENSVLTFHNKGHAIPENILEWINNSTMTELQSEKRTGVAPHAGIGLMIIKQITQLLNIGLSATSLPEEGTSFFLTFPDTDE